MDLALLSLILFLITVIVGIATRVNCGLVAMITSFILVQFFMPDMTLTDVYALGWPSKIFFMMLAVTLLFGMAGANGTMEIIAKKLIRLLHGRTRLMPIFIFLLTFILSAAGAGPGIAPMIMPIAMGLCAETGLSALMMGVMIEAGAGAGGMSPISTNGIIANGFAQAAGATEYIGMYIPYVLIMTMEAVAIYFIRGGYKAENVAVSDTDEPIPPMDRYQKLTTAVIICVIFCVILLGLDVAMVAMVGAAVLLVFGAMKDRKAISTVNWNTLMLVAGMFMLITLVDHAGGIELISNTIMKFITPGTGTGVMALLSGLLAIVTSSSGVVMPTLIPVAGNIAATMGHGVTADLLIAGVCSGANSAFYSPFSVLGSMTIAMYPETVDRDKIFVAHLKLTFASIAFTSILAFAGFMRLFL
ncbi:MAG: hypothetical protein IJJ31_04565 [Mogibacterium sp.]|nr:hypothetical protein [Mogibacterium sp.]